MTEILKTIELILVITIWFLAGLILNSWFDVTDILIRHSEFRLGL